jgi:hypothetical protein
MLSMIIRNHEPFLGILVCSTFILALIGQMTINQASAQIITGEPMGSAKLAPFSIFEVGIKMKANTSIKYAFHAHDRMLFDIHSHDGRQITTHSVSESDSFVDEFVAPTDGDYYFLVQNLQLKDISFTYIISIDISRLVVQHEQINYQISTVSNSRIELLDFSPEDKQISFRIESPYLTPGFANITIPRNLIDGPFTLQGPLTEQRYSQNNSSSVFIVETPYGTYDFVITGSTAVPEIPVPIAILGLASALIFVLRIWKKRLLGSTKSV